MRGKTPGPPMSSFRKVWLWPTVIAIVSAAGLVSALIGDGAWDVFSWVSLAIPLVIVGMAWRRSRTQTPAT